MKKIKTIIADIFFKTAIWFDPRLPDGKTLQSIDAMKYGTGICKRINPRDFFINPKQTKQECGYGCEHPFYGKNNTCPKCGLYYNPLIESSILVNKCKYI